FFQAEDGIRDPLVTGVQTCALPIFRLRDNVILHQPVSLVLVSSNQDRLAILVVLRTTGASAELFVLENADRVSSVSRFETLVATDDDRSSREVHSCGEGRSRCENFDPPVTTRRFYYATMRTCESRVVNSCTGSYLACEGLTKACLLS